MIKFFGWLVIVVGVIFDLLGTLGLVRFPDVYNRLQAATKSVTLGTFGIMMGIFILNGFTVTGIKALVCGAFLLLTAPVSAHALARGSLLFGIKMWKGSILDSFGKDKKKEELIEKGGENEDEVS